MRMTWTEETLCAILEFDNEEEMATMKVHLDKVLTLKDKIKEQRKMKCHRCEEETDTKIMGTALCERCEEDLYAFAATNKPAHEFKCPIRRTEKKSKEPGFSGFNTG